MPRKQESWREPNCDGGFDICMTMLADKSKRSEIDLTETGMRKKDKKVKGTVMEVVPITLGTDIVSIKAYDNKPVKRTTKRAGKVSDDGRN